MVQHAMAHNDSLPVIEGYDITDVIYVGSRTCVYRGMRVADGQAVVLKVLNNRFPALSDLLYLRNHYTITRHLNAPGVIQPLSLETYGPGYVLVMPDEGSLCLADYMAAHPVTLSEVLAMALQLTDILHDLYQHRIIHKDIKPSNILIQPESGQIKLTDFSIASLLPRETEAVKHPNVLEGTLAYLAPEQTGRMNRGIDYRTDFYALGVTLFELLTGQLPFQAEDPLELVHCHIAKPAPRVDQLPNGLQSALTIPAVVADIVAKLMAKNAEDRYQSALGLKHDLQRCWIQWQAEGDITPFDLATQDRCDRFTIPEKLYGREAEVQTLLAAFDRVAGSRQGEQESGRTGEPTSAVAVPTFPHSELMLVAGFSGIGKTAVVNEVHKPIVRQRGYFIKGKFDQFNRDIPFSAFLQAFRDLLGQLLSESDAQLAAWKAQILAAVGKNGQVIIDVIPELERIIGAQPSVPKLSSHAAQNRFNLLFQQFIQVFATPDHPLVMFLDDWQWADSASLKLLEVLLNNARCLLFIGAYRDNEVSPVHPLMLTVRGLEKSGATVTTLLLSPLTQADINQLVADTLSGDSGSNPDRNRTLAEPLTELVYQKTQGNPFFTTQFLKSLHQDGFIQFNPAAGYWRCDISQIKLQSLTNDVVQLMAQQLQKLAPETQRMLTLAACIGSQFDLQTLALVSEQAEHEAAAALWQALQDGLIMPLNQIYKFFQGELGDRRQGTGDRRQEIRDRRQGIANRRQEIGDRRQDLELLDGGGCEYRFLHDRVQQAAYSLIPESQTTAIHLQIGRLLRERTPADAQEVHLFRIVSQLNQGVALMQTPQEREDLAQLNWQAGEKARLAAAYDAAMTYLDMGLQLLSAQGWQKQYTLSLDLHQLAAEVAYISGDYPRMATLIAKGLHHAKTVLDQAKFHEIQVLALVAQNQARAAVDYTRQVLPKFGVHLPQSLSQRQIALGFMATLVRMAGKQPKDLLQLPPMTNPYSLVACNLFNAIGAAADRGVPEVLPFITFTGIALYLRYGNIPKSSNAYTIYAYLLCEKLGRVEAGYALGQAAIALCYQTESKPALAPTLFLWNYFIAYRKQPLQSTLSSFDDAYQVSLETGDIQYAAYSLCVRLSQAYWIGHNLTDLWQESVAIRPALQRFQQQAMIAIHDLNCQSLENLTTEPEDVCRFVGQFLDETAIAPDNRQLQAYTSLRKLQLAILFQRYSLAIEQRDQVEARLGMLDGTYSKTLFYFYDALVRLAVYDQQRPAQRRADLAQVKTHRQRLARLAKSAPMNYQHKVSLLDAERLRVLGRWYQAGEVYDRAIAGAKAHGFLAEEALANELAAQFYLSWHKDRIAAGYMQDAYYAYGRWGAIAKIRDLEQRYPQLLAPILQAEPETLAVSNTSSQRLKDMDLATILQASQTLSREIELDQLLHALIQLLVTNAGADKAVLFLNRENTLELAITYCDHAIQPLQSCWVDDCTHIPKALIHYVKRTQETVMTNWHDHPSLLNDAYCLQAQPQSLLCMPILTQGQLVAVLYLENAITANAFTKSRVELLNVLCAQAAISLENAQLYYQSQSYAHQLEHSLKQLQASETRFHHLATNIPGVIYQLRITADGKPSVPYASSRCYDLYEIAADEMMSGRHHFREFEHVEDRPAIDQKVEISRQTLQLCNLEFRIVTPSGQVKWVQAVAQPTMQPDGAIIWDGVVMDISDRKAVEAERNAAQMQLRDQAHQLAQANQQLEEYSQTLAQRVEERTQELSQALMNLQSAQQELIQSEKMAALGQLIASIAHEINTPLGVIRSATDNISAALKGVLQSLPPLLQRLSPQQQQDFLALVDTALQTQQTFSLKEERQLRQRLQTHLMAQGIAQADNIATYLTLLRLGFNLDPYQSLLLTPDCLEVLQVAYQLVQQAHNASSIQQAVAQAARIVSALKTYSHRSAEPEKYFAKITDGLEVALTLHANRLKQGIQVTRHYPPEIPKILCNPDELTQVWVNLIDNAIHAMGQVGTLDIAILTQVDQLVVAITDSGSGMPPDVQARIFEPFFTTKPRGEGSGLGLDIVKQIVQRHGGMIQVSSQPGRTTFTVQFPLPQPLGRE